MLDDTYRPNVELTLATHNDLVLGEPDKQPHGAKIVSEWNRDVLSFSKSP